jgi:hypothetical protein
MITVAQSTRDTATPLFPACCGREEEQEERAEADDRNAGGNRFHRAEGGKIDEWPMMRIGTSTIPR